MWGAAGDSKLRFPPYYIVGKCLSCGKQDKNPNWYKSSRFRRTARNSAHEEILDKYLQTEEKLDGEEIKVPERVKNP